MEHKFARRGRSLPFSRTGPTRATPAAVGLRVAGAAARLPALGRRVFAFRRWRLAETIRAAHDRLRKGARTAGVHDRAAGTTARSAGIEPAGRCARTGGR